MNRGWAVQITRKDGSTFLASSGEGNQPAVWVKSNRRWAVKHKRSLQEHGFKCRIVPVHYAEPVVVEKDDE